MKKGKTVNTKGFTLAELLVVVAIIGVLVAISIPIFSSQLEKSREAADIANVRAAYAQVRAAALSGAAGSSSIKETDTDFSVYVNLKQQEDNWQTETALNIGGITPADSAHWIGKPKASGKVLVSCTKDGETFITWDGGYYSAKLGAGKEQYTDSLNTFLNTLKTEIVDERLKNKDLHVAYVLITGGKVSSVSYYRSESDIKGVINNPSADQKLSAEQLQAFTDKLNEAMKDQAYQLANNETGRIFFDWNGNVCSGLKEDGTPIGIAGQGTGASIKLSSDRGNKDAASLKFNGDTWE